ncbi:MAG: rfaE [Ignavibacteria bacterium]|nr:rfaE [Ignavibacteria bacterium]
MLITTERVLTLSNYYRSSGKKIVFTNGCFDVLHAGHVRYLNEAAKLGDSLFIGLNDDASVRKLKGNGRPINSQDDRVEVLSALRAIDFIVLFSEDTPLNLIDLIKPDVLVKGGDYNADDIVGADIVRKNGGEVVVIPLLEGRSTSSLIDKMSKAK